MSRAPNATQEEGEVSPLLGDAKTQYFSSSEKEAAVKTWMNEKKAEVAQDGLTETHRIVLGVAYMCAMGVCGIVLVAIGSTLDTLAENCGTTSTAIGSVFLARGAGAVFGAIVSAKLYEWFHGNSVMMLALASLTGLLVYLPFITDVATLHIIFALMGIGTAVTDTGCQIMTRKVHGKAAGPWLGANTVAFGISGALVPGIELLSDSLFVQYVILSVITIATAITIAFVPDPESNGTMSGLPMKKAPRTPPPHFHVEWALAIMVFWLIGGKVTSTAYIESYIDETGVVSSDDATFMIMVLWTMITIGRLAGLQDQRFTNTPRLYRHLSIILVGGTLAMSLVLIFPHRGVALWVGIAFYGLFNGPCVGYCYDLNNRITIATEKGMAIVMFGLNFGASLVPYLTTLVWEDMDQPYVLIWTIMLSMAVPLPLLWLTRTLTYDPSVNPAAGAEYASVAAAAGHLHHDASTPGPGAVPAASEPVEKREQAGEHA